MLDIFFCQHKFVKKSHSKFSKNEPVCMCKKGWHVDSEQEGVSLSEGSGIVWNTLKGVK